MPHASQQTRDDLLAIWRAGTLAVHAQTLVQSHVTVSGNVLKLADQHLELDRPGRIVVVGAGKAAAGMAFGLEQALGSEWLDKKQVVGWVNVPDNCILKTTHIRLHPARPAAINEPTEESVRGTNQILQLISSLDPQDTCICLLTGGGSALLSAPSPPLNLDDKVAVTRQLSSAGADIRQLNTVRKQLSQIKGGGLTRHCRAGRLITLIISDVLGDPLDMIASGPTVVDSTDLTDTSDAIEILREFSPDKTMIPAAVWDYLGQSHRVATDPNHRPATSNTVIGNIDVALQAAAVEAKKRGYQTRIADTDIREPTVDEVAQRLVMTSAELLSEERPICWINGGEPTVQLVAEELRGKGGRNQQLVLATAQRWIDEESSHAAEGQSIRFSPLDCIALISAGTDGEDGPTDAAGAMIWPDLLRSLSAAKVDLGDFLRRNDAYHCLGPLGALIRTGPTQTNVCDLRVMIANRR